MTNLEIRTHAAQFAAHLSARALKLAPEDAWHRWSSEQGITSPAARMLFEEMYESRMSSSRSTRSRLLARFMG